MPTRIRLGTTHRIARKRFGTVTLRDVEAEALSDLKEVSAALSSAGIAHYLTYGALLGFVREGRLLAHDTDIDLAILGEVDPDKVRGLFVAMGFREFRLTFVDDLPGNQKFRRGWVTFDLYYLREDGPYRRDWCILDRRSAMTSTHLRMALTPLDCGGFSVPAPEHREAYLAHLYGDDWRVPNPGWNWRLSPPNAEMHLHWLSLPMLIGTYWKDWLRRRKAAP